MRGTGIGLLFAIGCTGEVAERETSHTGTLGGACGEVSFFDVTLRGRVEDASGRVVPDASVSLEERNWSPGEVHGTTRADGGGRFEIEGHRLPVVEDCWGDAVQFWLVGEASELWGDKPLNAPLSEAVSNGADPVDLDLDFPLILR